MDVPITWIVGTLLTLFGLLLTMIGLWVRIVVTLVESANALGVMAAKLDAALVELERVRPLESRVQANEAGIVHLRERVHTLAGAAQTKVR